MADSFNASALQVVVLRRACPCDFSRTSIMHTCDQWLLVNTVQFATIRGPSALNCEGCPLPGCVRVHTVPQSFKCRAHILHWVCVCIFVCVCVCGGVWVRVYICIYIHTHIHTHTHTYIHITHTHTHTPFGIRDSKSRNLKFS